MATSFGAMSSVTGVNFWDSHWVPDSAGKTLAETFEGLSQFQLLFSNKHFPLYFLASAH